MASTMSDIETRIGKAFMGVTTEPITFQFAQQTPQSDCFVARIITPYLMGRQFRGELQVAEPICSVCRRSWNCCGYPGPHVELRPRSPGVPFR